MASQRGEQVAVVRRRELKHGNGDGMVLFVLYPDTQSHQWLQGVFFFCCQCVRGHAENTRRNALSNSISI